MPVSKEDNDLMCRVEGDAPMGRLIRATTWVPAAISDQLIAGDRPIRIKLIGRKYILFRGKGGKVACYDEACPHRGASLALGRNEDDAVRCIYHGWKFDVEGRTVDVPTQPGDQQAFCKTVPKRNHPVRETAGVIWVWLGDGPQAPEFPELEFALLPPTHSIAVTQKVKYNWVLGVEGTLDSAHVGVLHQSQARHVGESIALTPLSQAPRYDFEAEKTGYRYAAVRDMGDGTVYTRVNHFVFPWYGLVCPSEVDGDCVAVFAVPVDDENAVHWQVAYNPRRPVESEWLVGCADRSNYPPSHGEPDDYWGQSLELLKAGHFTGFGHLVTEDLAVSASQGPYPDRSMEYLNPGDRAIVRMRGILLDNVKRFAAGEVAPVAELRGADFRRLRPAGAVLPGDADWRQKLVLPGADEPVTEAAHG